MHEQKQVWHVTRTNEEVRMALLCVDIFSGL